MKLRVEDDDLGGHLRMDVAEDVDDARLLRLDRLACPALVETEVETQRLRKREDVVKNVVVVRKLDRAADQGNGHRRREALVALVHAINAARGVGKRIGDALQVNDGIRVIRLGRAALRDHDAPANVNASRSRCRHRADREQPEHDRDREEPRQPGAGTARYHLATSELVKTSFENVGTGSSSATWVYSTFAMRFVPRSKRNPPVPRMALE